MTAYIDFETRSEVDVTQVGAYKYATHPTTEVLCMAYKIDHEKTNIWIPGFSRYENQIPIDLQFHVFGSENRIEAHNAEFEFNIWSHILVPEYGWPRIQVTQMRCSAVKAAMYALPRKLEKVAQVLELRSQKDMEGHRVMLQLTKPRTPSKNNPDKFFSDDERFDKLYYYCKQDVDTEFALSKRLREINRNEWFNWYLDQKINDRGIYIDVEGVQAAHDLTKKLEELSKKKIQLLTDGEVQAVTEIAKIKSWAERQGCAIDSMAAEVLPKILKSKKVPTKVKKVVALRHRNNKSSTAKLARMLDCVNEDGRIRNFLLFYGAHTGRWTGRGIQTTNLPQGNLEYKDVCRAIKAIKDRDVSAIKSFGNPLDVVSSCLRGFICAPPGKELICADYASIEARLVLWLAGEKKAVRQLEKGKDLYKVLASKIYGTPYKKVTRDQRQNGKRGILGCGYGMGWKRMQTSAAQYGVDLTDDMCVSIVDTYRSTYPKVKQLWGVVEESAIETVMRKKETVVPGIKAEVVFDMWRDFLTLLLPSGRLLTYHQPKISRGKFDKLQLSHMGVNSMTKQWSKHHKWGGVWVENIIQAIARDIMVYGMTRVEYHPKYSVLLNVYDEVLAECDKGAGNTDEYIALLTKKEPWAKTCPIEIKKNACWIGKRYRKD